MISTEHYLGVTADVEGAPNKLVASAKHGFALVDKSTGQLEWLARIYDQDGEETVRTWAPRPALVLLANNCNA